MAEQGMTSEEFVKMVRKCNFQELTHFFNANLKMIETDPVKLKDNLPFILHLCMNEFVIFTDNEQTYSEEEKNYYRRFFITTRTFFRRVYGIDEIKSEDDLGPELVSLFLQDLKYQIYDIELFTTFNRVSLHKLIPSILYNQKIEMSVFYDRLTKLYDLEIEDITFMIENKLSSFADSNCEFLQKFLIQSYKPAEIPPWVSILPYEKEIGTRLLDKDNYEILNQNPTNEDLDEVKKLFFENVIISDEINIDSFFDQYQGIAAENSSIYVLDGIPIDVNRIFGPTNPIIDSGEIVGCAFDGKPCRMLTCTCYGENWFDGSCKGYGNERDEKGEILNSSLCNKKIINISHCLRRPLSCGAFSECFCSEDCIRKKYRPKYSDIDEDDGLRHIIEEDDEDEETLELEVNKLTTMMLTIAESGILDRNSL